MKIWNPFKKTKPVMQRKATEVIWPIPQGSFLEYALGQNSSRLSPEKAMEFYRTNSTVATAVDMIAEAIEQIAPVLKLPNGDLDTKNEVVEFLKQPNGFDTWQEFIGNSSRHYLLTADSYLSLLGLIERPPLELYAIKPQNVSTTQADDYYPSAYSVTVGMGKGQYQRYEEGRRIRFLDKPLRELYHIMGFSSHSGELEGDSKLMAAALETKQQIQGKYHNLALLENGGRLSLVVSFSDEDIEDDEHQRRKRRINEDLGGSGNTGKIAVISGSKTDIKELGKTNKDMDFAELEKMASQAIYLRYGVPLPLVSTDASTFNNYETALYAFYENTVLPVTNILFQGLSKVLLPRFKVDGVLSYDPESIPVLIRQKLKEIKERRDINIETINELRDGLKREEIEGGDTLYQAANLVPVGEDNFTDDNLTAEELAERMNAGK